MDNNSSQQEQPTQDQSDVKVMFNATIGEINAIFGVVNASPFQSVMLPVLEDVSEQVRRQNIQGQQSQADTLKIVVPVTLSIGEINTIFSIITASGFVTVMKPIMDRMTEDIQFYVNSLAQSQQPAPQTMPQGQIPQLTLPPTEFGNN